LLAAVSFAFSLANTNYVKQLTQRVFINRSIEMTQGYQPLAEKAAGLELDGKKVAIAATDDGYVGLLYAYYLYPANVDSNVGYNPYTAGSTPQEYVETLADNGYEYLILYSFGETFPTDYAEIFAEGSSIEKEAVYRIDKTNLKLVKMA